MNAPSKITSGAIVRAPKAPSHRVWALRARACVCCVCPHQRNGDRDHLKLARWARRLSPSGVRMRSSVAICRRVWAHRSPCPSPCLPLCSLAQIAFSRVSEPNIGFCFFLYNNCLIVYITHEDRYRWSAYTHLVVSASNPQSHHIVVCFVKMCMCVGVPVCVCVSSIPRAYILWQRNGGMIGVNALEWMNCMWLFRTTTRARLTKVLPHRAFCIWNRAGPRSYVNLLEISKRNGWMNGAVFLPLEFVSVQLCSVGILKVLNGGSREQFPNQWRTTINQCNHRWPFVCEPVIG